MKWKMLQIFVIACFDQFFSYFNLIFGSFKAWMGSYNFDHLILIR